MFKILPFERAYWVIPGKLMAGEYPAAPDVNESHRKLNALAETGIKSIINLTEPGESNHNGVKLFDYTEFMQNAGIETHRIAIKDISVPSKETMEAIIELIDVSIKNDKPVYVHCWGGVGRTGTVVGTYLLHRKMAKKENVLEMINYLKRTTSIKDKSSPETEQQKKFILTYRLKGERLPIENYTGCLLGGAVGDALGAPIEFDSISSIRKKYGRNGVQDYVEFPDNKGEFTDDTQMTLFTAEGLLRAYQRFILKGIGGALNEITYQSYLRWLHTQGIGMPRGKKADDEEIIHSGWLIKERLLHKKRAPGNTVISALRSGEMGTINRRLNDSKGCGTIMRMAPVGLMFHGENKKAFEIACDLSAITHGHPSGYLSGGFLASMIADISNGTSLKQSIDNALGILRRWEDHLETYWAVAKALNLYEREKHNIENVTAETLEELGGGWVAEEALAISVYASLLFENDFKRGVLFSVNHSGDCDSTGSITGNILGLINGVENIPAMWIDNLVGHEIVKQVGEDLFVKVKGDSLNQDEEWWDRYPGF